MFYMITGLVPADSGQIFIDGRDVTQLPMYRRARLWHWLSAIKKPRFSVASQSSRISCPFSNSSNRTGNNATEQLEQLLEEFRIHRPPKITLNRSVGW